jgi:hypothetical protein
MEVQRSLRNDRTQHADSAVPQTSRRAFKVRVHEVLSRDRHAASFSQYFFESNNLSAYFIDVLSVRYYSAGHKVYRYRYNYNRYRKERRQD